MSGEVIILVFLNRILNTFRIIVLRVYLLGHDVIFVGNEVNNYAEYILISKLPGSRMCILDFHST